MSAEDQGSSGASGSSTSGDSSKPSDTVAYETYKKVLAEAKKYKAANDEITRVLEERENAVLTEQNKYKELAAKQKEQLQKMENELKEANKRFAGKSLKEKVSRYAKDFGAIDEAVDQIYSVGDWANVEIKDDYSVNEDQVKSLVAEMAKKNPWFFKKSAAAPKDVVLGSGAGNGADLSDLTKLSVDELIKLGKSLPS